MSTTSRQYLTCDCPSFSHAHLCESIHASPYEPGQQLDVTVDIGNYGGANTPSIAQVTVWWSDPTAGFVVGPDKLIGYCTVEVPPRGGRNTKPVMGKVIPPSAVSGLGFVIEG